MATAPKPPTPPPSSPTPEQPKPSTPPPPPTPAEPTPEGGKRAAQATTIGMKPDDPNDPQAKKFEARSVPPRWDEPKAAKEREAWTPKPALDPLAEKPPEAVYADGMSAPDEQRARAAWVEAHGLKEYDEAVDQRNDDEKPEFDPHALAGGGAFVRHGEQKQVQGVAPPTKRE